MKRHIDHLISIPSLSKTPSEVTNADFEIQLTPSTALENDSTEVQQSICIRKPPDCYSPLFIVNCKHVSQL